MIKILMIIISIIPILGGTVFTKYKNVDYKEPKDDWKIVSLGENYNSDETIELDLDGDSVKEKIEIKKQGKNIVINGEEIVINKYYKDNNNAQCETNSFNFVDLNDDGILEIIHRTCDNRISPERNYYTIFNYKKGNLKDICNISITGTIPKEIYVKNNTIKFEYWPFESPKDNKEEVKCKLEI